MRSANTTVVKHNPKFATVNLMNAAQAEDSSDVIMGNLPVNDIPAKVHFNTGALHVSSGDHLHLSMSCLSKICLDSYQLFLRVNS